MVKSCLRLLLIGIILTSVSTGFAQQTEDLKLLPSDGSESDNFGHVVAISGSTAIFGAPSADGYQPSSGAAYLFDTFSGVEIAKIFPTVSTGASFGMAVDIDDNLAIVGQPNGGGGGSGFSFLFDVSTGQQTMQLIPSGADPSPASFGTSVAVNENWAVVGAQSTLSFGAGGAAYVFDTKTGNQLHMFVPDDPIAAFQYFGRSVAIHGDLALVGAPGYPNEMDPAVYVFDLAQGELITTLMPFGGGSGWEFGGSVAMNADVAIVGGRRDDETGFADGAAYLFSVGDWQPIAKITPPDDFGDGFLFGSNVDIHDDVVIVGAHVFGAYLFDANTGVQLNRLLASDGASTDEFGRAVAISNSAAVVGAPGDEDNGNNSGSAYVYHRSEPDTDGDGLLDSWESNGIDINDDGLVDLDLPALGADPMRKDIFVEVDIMSGVDFTAEAQYLVQEAFANAPVENPDGSTGINLRIIEDGDVLPFASIWDKQFNDYAVSQSLFYGTSEERTDPNWENIKAARLVSFRYCAVVHKIEDAAGLGELLGNDFMVAYGGVLANDDDVQAEVFMHELGHNLGLHHGGYNYENNYKPNYVSVMNYGFWQFADEDGNRLPIDYSREELPDLTEWSVDETAGIGSQLYTHVFAPIALDVQGTRHLNYILLNGTPYNFNLDGDLDDQSVAVDFNWWGANYTGGDSPSPNQYLAGSNDWLMIQIPIGDGSSFAEGQYVVPEHQPRSEEDIVFLRENIPPPPVNVATIAAVQTVCGSITAGTAADLLAIDGATLNTLSDVDPQNGAQQKMELQVNAMTDVVSPRVVNVMVRSTSPTGVNTDLRVRNWDTGQFESVATFVSDGMFATDFVKDLDVVTYINSSGQIDVSILQTLADTTPFGTSFEQIEITIFEGPLLGDVNLDGAVNLLDVDPFIALLGSGQYQAEADVNQDGTVNLLDVDPFIAALAGN